MRFLSGRKRRPPDVPTASLADLAFTVMIFFVTFVMFGFDTGLRVTLPPLLEACGYEIPLKERNVLRVLINAQGEVFVEKMPMAVSAVGHEVVWHVTNDGRHPAYAETPRSAIVSIETDPRTPYRAYVAVLNDVLLGYRHVWNAEARGLGFADYPAYTKALEQGQSDEIRNRIPLNVALPAAGW